MICATPCSAIFSPLDIHAHQETILMLHKKIHLDYANLVSLYLMVKLGSSNILIHFYQSSEKPRNLLISLATGVASPGWYGMRDSSFISAIM